MRTQFASKQTTRARIRDLLVGQRVRTADFIARIAAMVTGDSLSTIDAATFGLFNESAGTDVASITATDKTLTSPDNPWSAADVGKTIDVAGAGAAGAVLRTVIESFTSAGEIELRHAAASTVAAGVTSAGGLAVWGYPPALTLKSSTLLDIAGSALHSLAPPIPGGAGRQVGDILADAVNVKDYGAAGDGVTDDTASIQKAFAAAVAAQLAISTMESGVDGYLTSAAAPVVLFPAGKYKVSASVGNGANNLRVQGMNALLFSTDRTINLLSLGTVNVTVDGMIFDGGAVHVRLGGSRVEAGHITIQRNQFRNAKTRCIKVDRADIPGFSGYPANLRIRDCKSYGSGFLEAYCNGTTIADSWLAWDTSGTTWDGGALIIANDNVRCYNLCEVPFNTNTNRHPRFQDATGFASEDYCAVVCYGCRFGGEATKTPIAHFRTKFSSLLLDGCAVFGVANGYWLHCDAIPEHITVRGCNGGTTTGLIDTWGMWFNSALAVADIPAMCRFRLDLGTVYQTAYVAISSADKTVNGGARFALVPQDGDRVGTLLRNYDIGDGFTFWAAPYTLDAFLSSFGGGTNLLGNAAAGLVNFSGEGYYGIQFPTFNPGTAGPVTFSCWVRASSRSAWYFQANATQATTVATGVLEPGMNRITVTFYHAGTGATTPKLGLTGRNGDSHAVGFFQFNLGRVAGDWQPAGYTVESISREFYGTAAPVAQTWRVGDRVRNTAPAVGSPKAWVCTVAGTPGTWVSEGNL